ncbi:glycosyl transferase [Streptomyces capoamus]|uniref:Glycosyl transferase n=1 Tax=Streptomyces capoamus TaxID=68183 RepID=A0A919KFM1_9ACTN|nr:glycosyltransferase family 2 protein [Streptomyces capoamus]GGP32382.1 glycosyl transferase [Streptomyces libani subsp. rufus]GHG72629.1 glycosyl transferase [Streptomyces capoamus]
MIISVVTPIHGEGTAFLTEAYASLVAQTLPAGWSWEWCIQEDGREVQAAAHLPTDDPRIRISASRQGGPHVARTLAFARSSGQYVKNLDSDDQLAPGALARDIAVLEAHPAVGWTTSRVLDLLEDGAVRSFEHSDPEPGILPQGSAYGFWIQHRRPQIHPATLCVRRPLLALLGGWMALPASGDTGLLLGLDALSSGWFIGDVGLLYRKHDGQITAHPDHRAGPEWEARMSLIQEHAEALRAWSARMPQ